MQKVQTAFKDEEVKEKALKENDDPVDDRGYNSSGLSSDNDTCMLIETERFNNAKK